MGQDDHSSSQVCGQPQQGTGFARPAAVAPPVPCDVQSQPTRILRLPEVMERVGLCRASIYAHAKLGNFPKQVTLGPRAVGWLESEIEAWITQRISMSRGTKA